MSTIRDRIEDEMFKRLAFHSFRKEEIARSIGMSERTMDRRLKKEKTLYSKILTDLRSSIAIEYLKHTNASMTEIAFKLGFAESSSFNHAFKQWTGKNPSDYRLSTGTKNVITFSKLVLY